MSVRKLCIARGNMATDLSPIRDLEAAQGGIRERREGAGKDPRQMPVLVEQFVVVGDENDAKTSAELWRFLPKAFKSYFNIRDPQAIQDRLLPNSRWKRSMQMADKHRSGCSRQSADGAIQQRRDYRKRPFRPGRSKDSDRVLWETRFASRARTTERSMSCFRSICPRHAAEKENPAAPRTD